MYNKLLKSFETFAILQNHMIVLFCGRINLPRTNVYFIAFSFLNRYCDEEHDLVLAPLHSENLYRAPQCLRPTPPPPPRLRRLATLRRTVQLLDVLDCAAEGRRLQVKLDMQWSLVVVLVVLQRAPDVAGGGGGAEQLHIAAAGQA